MHLVVGLGNPGSEYSGTRHNVGFAALDTLMVKAGWASKPGDFDRLAKSKFDGLMMDGAAGPNSDRLLLLKPLTYMNLSGRSVQAAMAFYQLTAADVMIVLDEDVYKRQLCLGSNPSGVA